MTASLLFAHSSPDKTQYDSIIYPASASFSPLVLFLQTGIVHLCLRHITCGLLEFTVVLSQSLHFVQESPESPVKCQAPRLERDEENGTEEIERQRA